MSFYSLKEIEKGEELFYHYNDRNAEHPWLRTVVVDGLPQLRLPKTIESKTKRLARVGHERPAKAREGLPQKQSLNAITECALLVAAGQNTGLSKSCHSTSWTNTRRLRQKNGSGCVVLHQLFPRVQSAIHTLLSRAHFRLTFSLQGTVVPRVILRAVLTAVPRRAVVFRMRFFEVKPHARERVQVAKG